MEKQLLYYILKINTSKLEKFNYNLSSTIDEARLNGELISMGDNQVFYFLRKIKGEKTDVNKLHELYLSRDFVKCLPSSPENNLQIAGHQKDIDEILFIPEVVNVKVDSKKAYRAIRKNGFHVNGRKYRRLCTGAGQSRRNTATFIDERFYNELNEILMNGLKVDKINISKFNAYFGLYMSTIKRVTTPRVCVIKDCEINLINKKIDWIIDCEKTIGEFTNKKGEIIEKKHQYRTIEERVVPELPMNVFDGQGLISPRMAQQWTNDLKLDFTPCQFIVRSSFIKGMLTTFDFHQFAEEVAETSTIIDYYGKEWNIEDIDVLLSVSQFKMYKQYKSWEEYLNNCEKYEHIWGVSRWNKRFDDDISLLNYQYIQTLNLEKEDIKELAQPTIDWINKICSGDKLYTLLFLLGAVDSKSNIDDVMNRIGNNFIKAIVYNDSLLQDEYILNKVYNSIEKRIQDAKIGRLWTRGNYQTMVSDPYAQAEHAFGLDVKGLLGEKEYYSKFWNNLEVDKVDACRSPLVDFHEHNLLTFKQNETITKWYKHSYSGIIYPIWGLDTIRHSDSDFDGDIVYTTDNPIMINGIIPDLNVISYDKITAPSQKLTESNITKSDLQSFDCKVGPITNFSTGFISLLAKFMREDPEGKNLARRKELLNRIKLLRRYIGDSIDAAKGIKMKPFPKEWKSPIRKTKNETEEEKAFRLFYNSLIEYYFKEEADDNGEVYKHIVRKKPYFMIYIYDTLREELTTHNNIYKTKCKREFGISLNDLMKKEDKTEEEVTFLREYNQLMPVFKSNCTMNILCHMIEDIDFSFKRNRKKPLNNLDLNLLMNNFIPKNEKVFKKIEELYRDFESVKYKKHTRKNSSINYDGFSDIDLELEDSKSLVYEYFSNKALELCNNTQELANYCVEICYSRKTGDKDFLWNIAGEGLVKNIRMNTNTVEVPVYDDTGKEYLGKYYTLKEIEVDKNDSI